MKTIKQIAQLAIDLQNASNLRGLVISWGQWSPVIRMHAEEIGVDYNSHPINQLMADKIHQLACNYNETDYLKIMPIIEALAAG